MSMTNTLRDGAASAADAVTQSSSQQSQASAQKSITLHVEFTGGLELIFSNVRKHKISLPVGLSGPPTCGNLIAHLAKSALADHPQRNMFVLDEDYQGGKAASTTVRPGILVIVNEADWALDGEEDCVLEEGDEVVFVSTLHGG